MFSNQRRKWNRNFLTRWLAGALVCLIGCQNAGRPVVPTGTVTGTVTIAGEPLVEGQINFISDEQGFGASGKLQPDGTYTLEGPIPAGEYGVFITFNISPAEVGTPAEDVKKSIPEKYQAQATSGLKVDVGEGINEIPIDLE